MLAVLLPLGLSALVLLQDRERELAAQIEKSVVLPKGAKPLSSYGRNYAYASSHRVVAVYAIPPSPRPEDEQCSVAAANFESRPCTKEEIAENRRMEAFLRGSQATAGESRWFKSRNSLPLILDGGCSVIAVEYDSSTQRFVSVACNGEG